MEYLHLITDKYEREFVQDVAQNIPSLRLGLHFLDANILLALGHTLIGNTHCQKLWLSNLVLTKEATHALAQGMAQSKIEVLHLNGNCQESPSLMESSPQGNICNIFYCGIQASSTIRHLNLKQSLTSDPGNAWRDVLLGLHLISIRLLRNQCHGYMQAFSWVLLQATVLRELSVHLVERLEPDDMTILAHSLCQNTSVTTPSLGCENLGNIQLLFLQELNPNSLITKLSISSSNIDDGCIELLLNHWLPNCSLEELMLSSNKIGPPGAQHLMQMVAAHYLTMSKLSLSCNCNIGYEGLHMIGNELPNLHHLTNLNLFFCSPRYDNFEAECDKAQNTQARQQAEQALLDGIKHNLSITTLEIYLIHHTNRVIMTSA